MHKFRITLQQPAVDILRELCTAQHHSLQTYGFAKWRAI